MTSEVTFLVGTGVMRLTASPLSLTGHKSEISQGHPKSLMQQTAQSTYSGHSALLGRALLSAAGSRTCSLGWVGAAAGLSAAGGCGPEWGRGIRSGVRLGWEVVYKAFLFPVVPDTEPRASDTLGTRSMAEPLPGPCRFSNRKAAAFPKPAAAGET